MKMRWKLFLAMLSLWEIRVEMEGEWAALRWVIRRGIPFVFK